MIRFSNFRFCASTKSQLSGLWLYLLHPLSHRTASTTVISGQFGSLSSVPWPICAFHFLANSNMFSRRVERLYLHQNVYAAVFFLHWQSHHHLAFLSKESQSPFYILIASTRWTSLSSKFLLQTWLKIFVLVTSPETPPTHQSVPIFHSVKHFS